MFPDIDPEILRKHKGKILSGIAFLLLGILFVTIGFFKTFFVLFLAVIGLAVGLFIDNPEAVRSFINKFLNR